MQHIKDKKINQIKMFTNPVPKRGVGFVYSNTFIKKYLLNVLKNEILNVTLNELKQNKNGLIIH